MNQIHINYTLKQWAAKKGKVYSRGVWEEIDFSTIKQDYNKYIFFNPDGYGLTSVTIDYDFCINLPFKNESHKLHYLDAIIGTFVEHNILPNLFMTHNATIAQRLEAYYESR